MSSRPPDRPSGPGKPPGSQTPTPGPWPRWLPLVVLGIVVAIFLFTSVRTSNTDSASLTYSQFTDAVAAGQIKNVNYDPSNGKLSGDFKAAQNGKTAFTSSGPNNDLQANQLKNLQKAGVDVKYVREGSNPLVGILLWVLPLVLIIGFFVWMNRRAQGQMGAVMNIGRSRQGLRRREAEDHVLRCRGIRAGQAGDHRGRRLPEEPGQVQGDRRAHPARRAARRPAGHRQDAARARGRR